MKDLIKDEPMVVIPDGMDCRELKFRIRDAAPGTAFVRFSPYEMRTADWRRKQLDELTRTNHEESLRTAS